MVCDGYVKYEEAEVHRSAYMQDFRDEEKMNKMDDWRPFLDCIIGKCVMGYRVWDLIFCFIFMVQLFCIIIELRKYHKITQIRYGR